MYDLSYARETIPHTELWQARVFALTEALP